jgi:hypothetical protein
MTLKDLENLLKVCRKYGVLSFAQEGISLTLAEQQPESRYKKRQEGTASQAEPELSEEQLLMWSAGGLADDS